MAIGIAVVVPISILTADTARGAQSATSVPFGVSQPVTVPAKGTPLTVIGDSLYTGADDGSRLNAYSLRTGRQRWSVAIPNVVGPRVTDAGSYLLLTSTRKVASDPSAPTSAVEIRTIAVEAGTGAVGWQRPGEPIWLPPAGDRVAIATYQAAADESDPDRTVVAVVDVANGAESAVFGPIAQGLSMSPVFSTETGSRSMAGMFVREDSKGGQLFDFADARVRRFDLPLPSPPVVYGAGDRPRYEALFIAGDMVLNGSSWGGRNVLAGYAGVPPRPRWTVPDVPIFGVWRCGAALCGSDPGQSFALDPGSGEIRWRSPGDMLWRASDRLGYSSARVGGASGNEGTGIAVLDETTGRQLLRQDSWRPVTPIEGPRIPILAYSPAGQVLAVLDARRLNADRLALLPQGVPDCWAGKTYVTCRVGTDTFRAWRYSP
jgi:outer membrane protein assembly factor BamB